MGANRSSRSRPGSTTKYGASGEKSLSMLRQNVRSEKRRESILLRSRTSHSLRWQNAILLRRKIGRLLQRQKREIMHAKHGKKCDRLQPEELREAVWQELLLCKKG